MLQYSPHRAVLDNPPGIHDRHLVSNFGSHPNIRFTNSRSLPSPQALALETLWIFSIVSRCASFKSKGRKMPRVEIEIVRQAPRRTHGLAIPRAHRLWRTDRRDGFHQRPGS